MAVILRLRAEKRLGMRLVSLILVLFMDVPAEHWRTSNRNFGNYNVSEFETNIVIEALKLYSKVTKWPKTLGTSLHVS